MSNGQAISLDNNMRIAMCDTEECEAAVIFTEDTMLDHIHPDCKCEASPVICCACKREPNKCSDCATRKRQKKKRKIQERLVHLEEEHKTYTDRLHELLAEENPAPGDDYIARIARQLYAAQQEK